jgi:ABC-type polysaccharide/polyol phosphate export permease
MKLLLDCFLVVLIRPMLNLLMMIIKFILSTITHFVRDCKEFIINDIIAIKKDWTTEEDKE